MLQSLRLHNFKTFLNFEVSFARRQLILGRNNTGKTNLSSALRFLSGSASLDYQSIPIQGGLEAFCNRTLKSNRAVFRCNCTLDDGPDPGVFEYELQVEVHNESPVQVQGLRTVSERLTLNNGSTRVLLESDGRTAYLADKAEPEGSAGHADRAAAPVGATMLSKVYDTVEASSVTRFRRFLASVAYYSFSPPLMRYEWSRVDAGASLMDVGVLGWYGQNLPTVLFRIKMEDEPNYRRIMELVRVLEPDLDSLNFYVTPDQKVIPYLMLGGNRRASWESLSDGTLCLLALATALVQARRRQQAGWPAACVFIEEPENSLHRASFQELWGELLGLTPETQVIFTSHSPYFVDLFDRDLGSILYLKRQEGVTTAASLKDYQPEIEQYRGQFSLGELHYKELFG